MGLRQPFRRNELMLAGAVVVCRYSLNVESSVGELIASVRQPLSETELDRMLRGRHHHRHHDAMTQPHRSSDVDVYTALLNHFTQRNTDALVKCTN